MLLFLLACMSAEERVYRCSGPLIELVQWRDELSRRPLPPPAELAALERERVLATVERLRPVRGKCENHWHFLMYENPNNPALRLREEALLITLDAPPHDYPPDAVGEAGVTVAGRPPTSP